MQHCERLTLAGRSEEKLQALKDKLSSFFIDEHRLEAVSYTHLDVYKRQAWC